MEVRPITNEDLDQITGWLNDAGDVARYMSAPAFRGLIAVDEGQQQGIVYGWHYADEVEVIDILVNPSHRRHGVGMLLLMAFIQGAKATSCKLELRADNEPALKLYEKFGFNKDGIRANYYHDDRGYCDAVLMTYRLVSAEEN